MVLHVLTCDISEAGECYTFGSNQFSQLGYNTEFKKDRFPERVETLVVSMVACGDTFSVVVTKGGYLCISRPIVRHRKCIFSRCLTLLFNFHFDGLMDFDLLILDNNNDNYISIYYTPCIPSKILAQRCYKCNVIHSKLINFKLILIYITLKQNMLKYNRK